MKTNLNYLNSLRYFISVMGYTIIFSAFLLIMFLLVKYTMKEIDLVLFLLSSLGISVVGFLMPLYFIFQTETTYFRDVSQDNF